MAVAPFPSHAEVFSALRATAQLLKRDWAYLHNGAYHFTMGDDWSLGVTPESARRLKIDLWRGGVSRCTVWTQVEDHSRLAEAVEGLVSEVLALTG